MLIDSIFSSLCEFDTRVLIILKVNIIVMKLHLPIGSLIILTILITIQVTHAQEFNSDLEVKDIRTRIVDASWEIDVHNDRADPTINNSRIMFNLQFELWNPYDRGLVSYGSSS